ncbi:molybdopterin-guanine dinucleotide biosynthesis protein B [Bacillus ectoiniformans]|uniref:molybdopterin-guanine dinucleotide biosynthesis protein B n=1 Tax=Bacillus ectoiniformans TaxID=1494429 RepID=UPI001EF84F09|nr:molybdopterin-guanine dinucleotide biosynthesis protein B [Bacillus ectoiniformans]MBM7649065.1 molybdopterin-guanine dinucleotide biosynthesis protein B [Bacillus ectoiniformans]
MTNNIPIIQVVGYKNSGKTTLVCRMIESVAAKGLQVSACKHHGHGGEPDAVTTTDSARHSSAGAIMSGVEGDGMLQLNIRQDHWKLDKILRFYQLIETDVLILEGFKKAPYPKVVLINRESDLKLLDELENVIAVISTFDIQFKKDHIVYFLREQEEEFIEWFLEKGVRPPLR